MAQKIITSFDNPPIPARSHDWSAVLDGYDGAPDAGWQAMGHGATEAEAIADIKAELEDHDAVECPECGDEGCERIHGADHEYQCGTCCHTFDIQVEKR